MVTAVYTVLKRETSFVTTVVETYVLHNIQRGIGQKVISTYIKPAHKQVCPAI